MKSNITYLPLLLLSLIFAQFSSADDNKIFKIGVILPLTGPLSLQGVPMQNAIILAKEQLDTNNRLKLIIEDDGFLPRNTVAAANKLINQDHIDSLIVFGTNQGMSVVDLTEKKKIPFISINVNRNVVRNKKYSVIMLPSVEALTATSISESMKKNYKNLAIIATQQDSCLLQRKIMEESNQFNIVYSDEIFPNDTKVREQAFKMITKNPDAIFLSVLPPQGSLFAKALREFGYKGELFGGLQIANLAEREASNGALIAGWVVAGDDREAKEYYQTCSKRFKETPTGESVYAYDSIKLLLEGLSTPDLNQFLHQVENFQGYAGKYSADGENGYTFKVVGKTFTKEGFKYLN